MSATSGPSSAAVKGGDPNVGLSSHAKLVLGKWRQFHKDCPIPTEQDCITLMKATGLSTDAIVGYLLTIENDDTVNGEAPSDQQQQQQHVPKPVVNDNQQQPSMGMMHAQQFQQYRGPTQQQQQLGPAAADGILASLSCGLPPEAEGILNSYVSNHLQDGMPPDQHIMALASRLQLSMPVIMRAIMTKRAVLKSGLLNARHEAQQQPQQQQQGPMDMSRFQYHPQGLPEIRQSDYINRPSIQQMSATMHLSSRSGENGMANNNMGIKEVATFRFRKLKWGEVPSTGLENLMLVPCKPKDVSDRDLISYWTTSMARVQDGIFPPKPEHRQDTSSEEGSSESPPSTDNENEGPSEVEEDGDTEKRRVSPRKRKAPTPEVSAGPSGRSRRATAAAIQKKRRRTTSATSDESYTDSEMEPTFPDD